jgi:hypothetical protein
VFIGGAVYLAIRDVLWLAIIPAFAAIVFSLVTDGSLLSSEYRLFLDDEGRLHIHFGEEGNPHKCSIRRRYLDNNGALRVRSWEAMIGDKYAKSLYIGSHYARARISGPTTCNWKAFRSTLQCDKLNGKRNYLILNHTTGYTFRIPIFIFETKRLCCEEDSESSYEIVLESNFFDVYALGKALRAIESDEPTLLLEFNTRSA